MPQYNIFWWESLLTSQDNGLLFLGNILTLCEKWIVFKGLLKSQCHQWRCPKLLPLLTYFPSSLCFLGFPGGSDSKESAHNMGDLGSIPGLGRFPCPGYYKQCCNEQWGTCVSFNSGFLGEYAQQWDCWVIRQCSPVQHSHTWALLTTELRAEVPSTHFHFLSSLTYLMCTSLLYLLLLLITYPPETFSHSKSLAHLSVCFLENPNWQSK